MREITQAVSAKQMQISKLQSDIEALQRAAAVLQGKNAPAKVTASKPKAKRKRRKKRLKKDTQKAIDRIEKVIGD